MKKRNLLLVILAVLLVFGLVMSCDPDGTGGTGGGGTTNTTATLNGVTANGDGLLESTTELTLSFDKAITGLAASNITLGAGATKGALSGGTGGVYKLTVTGVTANANVTVTVTRSGWTINGSPATVAVKYSAAEKASKYFSGYLTNYSLNSNTVIEKVKFDKNKLMIWDDTNDGGKLNYFEVSITKWEDYQTPDFTSTAAGITKENFNIGFKLTCKIQGAYKVNTNNLYGSTTGPNLGQTDITNKSEVIIFLYVWDNDGDFTILRSIFAKTGSDAPIKGTNNEIRYYPENPAASTYPTITP